MVKTSHTHNRIVWLIPFLGRTNGSLGICPSTLLGATQLPSHVIMWKNSPFLPSLWSNCVIWGCKSVAENMHSWESKGTQCQSMPHQGSTYFFWEIPCSLWTFFFPTKKARNSPHSTKGSKRKEGMNGCQWATGLTRPILPETNISPENRFPGKGDSYWTPSFLGAMLVAGSVIIATFHEILQTGKQDKFPHVSNVEKNPY